MNRIGSVAVVTIGLLCAMACSSPKRSKTAPPSEAPPATPAPPKATCDKAVAHGLRLCALSPECGKYINSGTLSAALTECQQKYRENEKLLGCVLALERIEDGQTCFADVSEYRIPDTEKGMTP